MTIVNGKAGGRSEGHCGLSDTRREGLDPYPIIERRGLPSGMYSGSLEQRHLQINKSQPLGLCHAFVLLNKVEPESNFD